MRPPHAPPTIVAADDWLVVADKPAGLLAVPGRHEADCLAARVQALAPDALVVHRLDQPTSGLVVFGRGADAQRRLTEAFAGRRVAKRYVAVVAGRVAADEGTVDLPLAADWPNRPRQRVDREHGRAALTRWRVLERGAATTRLELEPVTGRTHQLRVHCAAIGHPILGDALYGDAAAAPRLLLHAQALALPHPADDAPVAFTAAPPF